MYRKDVVRCARRRLSRDRVRHRERGHRAVRSGPPQRGRQRRFPFRPANNRARIKTNAQFKVFSMIWHAPPTRSTIAACLLARKFAGTSQVFVRLTLHLGRVMAVAEGDTPESSPTCFDRHESTRWAQLNSVSVHVAQGADVEVVSKVLHGKLHVGSFQHGRGAEQSKCGMLMLKTARGNFSVSC